MSDEGFNAECASCNHDEMSHGSDGTGVCGECGCWGFFPSNARYCNNPGCEGSVCASQRNRKPGGAPRLPSSAFGADCLSSVEAERDRAWALLDGCDWSNGSDGRGPCPWCGESTASPGAIANFGVDFLAHHDHDCPFAGWYARRGALSGATPGRGSPGGGT